MEPDDISPLRSLAIDPATYLLKEWDDLTLAARTLITEKQTGTVVSRSLPKFFNYNEKFAYKPTGNEHAFAIEEKVDGSLISLFWYGGKWMFVSRTSFQSPHAESAQRILDTRYPGALKRLDKESTYVFELVDPKMPIKVVYTKEDLVLLSIVAKDGKEPPHNFDWTALSFSRPKRHVADTVAPSHLSKLNHDNEEGFVVKFWTSPNDRYPKRIKIKFESYFELAEGWKGKPSSSPRMPPSNSQILEIYSKHRLQIHHFKTDDIANTMAKHRENFLNSLEKIADDYGGAPWLNKIEKTWDRIDAIFTLQEGELTDAMSRLKKEGYIPSLANAKSNRLKDTFRKRMRRGDINQKLREALMAWYIDDAPVRRVAAFVNQLEIPVDLRSTEVLGKVEELV
ncbi:Putative bifunctional polynucleotide kinase/RNA ligase [Psilocybe cubensis]|uniref:Bifunctional polynucleotide kinase/RNA ligase n=1 Tax=Psilocybe cubensis TaxID=181762 RepID=A0ACB8GW04_PSICU|nr:Putative bifunctional polynucleotide kinase/RNA ligase [Psilocybe cubensis]KAH9479811.1 Putative bifunctional polynucleotide kinase/RNA ligase [Psilocybe cubensis]